ncbi:MAG TPA: hypothetical protein VN493_10860 [Thermoanaerobaculia bacterium]|nr:hypothetical protein [Thermoanaerobaculia bacterium]
MRSQRLLPILLLPLALSGSVQAQQSQAKPAEKKQQAPQENPYLERFKQLDRDSDGYVSPSEWPLDADSFTVVDRNKDGRLSKGELLTPNTFRRDWDPQLQPPARPRRLDRDRREPSRDDLESTWGAHATIQDQRLLRNLDRNRDNRLGRREWTGTADRFHRLDRNQDGVLSPRELSRN